MCRGRPQILLPGIRSSDIRKDLPGSRRKPSLNPKLSIAIPTYKRANRLEATLEAFLPQLLPHHIPVCVSYTDDTDATHEVIERFRRHYPHVVAVTDPRATNIDRKIVSAASLVSTPYFWLFGDDDLPEHGAIDRILRVLEEDPSSLLILNASTYDSDLLMRIEERRLHMNSDRVYGPGDHERLLVDTASYVTFLGGLVFEKAMWDSVDSASFLDSDYVHVAVLFRAIPGRRATVIAEPQLRMRLARTTWASRYFEVELIHWPQVIWGLPSHLYSEESKARICERTPTTSLSRLLATRAYGYYSPTEYQRFVANDSTLSKWKKAILRIPLLFPRSLLVCMFIIYRRGQAILCHSNPALSIFRMTMQVTKERNTR